MADNITQAAAVDFANKDTNRLDQSTIDYIARTEPYSDTIEGGILTDYSETQRVVVAEMAWSNDSMVNPVFMPSVNACGVGGFTQEVGNTEFTYTPGNAKYLGPRICIKSTRVSFKDSYRMAVNSLREIARLKQGADIRATYLNYGGCKLVVDSTATFAQAFSGGINTIGDPTAAGGGTGQFAARTPDAPVTHRLLEYLAGYLLEVLNVQPYKGEKDGKPYYKWIGSLDSIQGFKDELGASLDLRAQVAGSYQAGLDTMTGYSWDGPYRGIVHGIDPMPLRANTVTSGVPTLLEPYTRTQVTNGYAGRPSSTWAGATYEIGFLCGQPPFQKLTPTYQQIPGFNFPPQLVNGQLEFKVIEDNGSNFWGEFGVHRWQVERAYKPLVPHAVIAVLYRRASNSLANLGVSAP